MLLLKKYSYLKYLFTKEQIIKLQTRDLEEKKECGAYQFLNVSIR